MRTKQILFSVMVLTWTFISDADQFTNLFSDEVAGTEREERDLKEHLKETSIIFEEVGHMTTSLNYFHVSLTINVTQFLKSVKLLNAAATQFSQDLSGLITAHPSITNFSVSVEKEVWSNVNSLINDVDELKRSMKTESRRNLQDYVRNGRKKRFLFALLACVGSLFGLLSYGEVTALNAKVEETNRIQDQMIKVLQEDEIRISTLEEDVRKLAQISAELAQRVSNTNIELHVLEAGTRLNLAIARMRGEYDRIMDCLQAAMHHRLSVRAVKMDNLEEMFTTMSHKASKKGFRLIPDDPFHFFQLETTFVYTNDTIQLIVHVPMVRTKGLLTLYKFVPFPVPFAEDPETGEARLTVEVNPVETYIAVDLRGGGGGYKAFKESELALCETFGTTYLCKFHNVLQLDFNKSCIGALYRNRLPEVRRNCKYTHREAREIIHQSNSNTFLVYTPAPTEVIQQCTNGTVQNYGFSGTNSIQIDEGCFGKTQSHVFYPDHDLRMNERFKTYKVRMSLKTMLMGMDETSFLNITQRLATLGTVPTDVRDIRTIYDLDRHQTSQMWYHYVAWALGAAAGIAALVLIAFCVIGVWRYKRALTVAQEGEGLAGIAKQLPGILRQSMRRRRAPASAPPGYDQANEGIELHPLNRGVRYQAVAEAARRVEEDDAN